MTATPGAGASLCVAPTTAGSSGSTTTRRTTAARGRGPEARVKARVKNTARGLSRCLGGDSGAALVPAA